MRTRNQGFTLIELIIVLAIILVLAAILFPVFAAVKGSANKTVCAANFRQAWVATNLYFTDYDDRLMPTNHQPTEMNSRADRTWVQLILPYINEFDSFQCPSDTGQRPKPEATFDQDLIPGDTASRYYQASQRSNIGYNYLYLAPVVKVNDVWVVQPHAWSDVSTPAQSLMFIDTVYELRGGHPTGGGNYLAIPPCRYENNDGGKVDTFFSTPAGVKEAWTLSNGWTSNPNSNFVYGGAWPWHMGRITVIRMDGSTKAINPQELSAGCDVKDQWGGLIQDGSKYIWRIMD